MTAKSPALHTYQVTHSDLGSLRVAAADKYAAIIAAAKEWNVRWTRIAKDCTVQDLGPQQETLCKRCKTVWVDKPGYCPRCQALVDSRNREIDRFAKAAAARKREREGR